MQTIDSLEDHKIFRWWLSISLLCFIVVAASCRPNPEKRLKIGTNIWPGYEILYLARDLGYLDGLPVDLVEMTSASEVINAMRNGTINGAGLTLDETITLLDEGVPLKVILLLDASFGADALLAKPTFQDIEQLRGKRIAIENTAVGAILLNNALESAGMNLNDITIVPCTADRHPVCFDDVDAVVTFEPSLSKIRKKGAIELFSSKDIPGTILDILVVSEDV